jgi:hypothetical protein
MSCPAAFPRLPGIGREGNASRSCEHWEWVWASYREARLETGIGIMSVMERGLTMEFYWFRLVTWKTRFGNQRCESSQCKA